MAYFDDLTTYTYDDEEIISLGHQFVTVRPWYTRLNVGWLDPAHEIPRGPVPPEFLRALLEIVAGPHINVMRGFQPCLFCPQPHNREMVTAEHHGRRLWLGNGEVRVPDGPAVMFAAPTLIWHYIDAHSYRPPDRFISAVSSYDDSWITKPTAGENSGRRSCN